MSSRIKCSNMCATIIVNNISHLIRPRYFPLLRNGGHIVSKKKNLIVGDIRTTTDFDLTFSILPTIMYYFDCHHVPKRFCYLVQDGCWCKSFPCECDNLPKNWPPHEYDETE